MENSGSVTNWLDHLAQGHSLAGQQLWQRYFQQLVALARRKLANTPRRVADEEDVALSAFDSFLRGVEKGRFPELSSREELWRLLVVLTARKASHLRRDLGRVKRGGQVSFEPLDEELLLDELLAKEPDPAFAAEMMEQCEMLLRKLPDEELRKIAIRRMEGETVEEIAVALDYAPRSIKRKLQLIRSFWIEEAGNVLGCDLPPAGEEAS
jgi:DNA-directed RNA polymerase specialized sigma24 family protein